MAGAFGGLLAGVITQYMDGVGNTPGWQWVSRHHPDIVARTLALRRFFKEEGSSVR